MPSQRFHPYPTLCTYILAFVLSDYGIDGFINDTTCIYPAGSAILCFSLDTPFLFKEIGSGSMIKLSKFNFIPQFKRPRFYEVIANPRKVLHVIFKPYGAYRLLAIPQNSLFDEHGTSLFDMLATKTRSLLNQVEDAAHDIALVIQLLNDWLEMQLVSNERIDVSRVSHACMLIDASQGMLPIEQLAKKAWLSKRALEYRFQEQVGLSPKMYSRIKRFNSLLSVIKKARVTDWQEVMFAYNYFDQAHLIKDFKYFSGNPPSRLPEINPILTTDYGL